MKLLAVILSLLGTIAFATPPVGLPVDTVTPGSNYEKLGVQKGDRVVSYDGKQVVAPGDAMDLYNALRAGSVKRVVIIRNGKEQTLTATH